MKSMRSKAFKEGYEAFEITVLLGFPCNPYDQFTQEYDDWWAGMDQAAKELREGV